MVKRSRSERVSAIMEFTVSQIGASGGLVLLAKVHQMYKSNYDLSAENRGKSLAPQRQVYVNHKRVRSQACDW